MYSNQHSQRHNNIQFQYTPQGSIIQTVWYWPKDRHADQRFGIETPYTSQDVLPFPLVPLTGMQK